MAAQLKREFQYYIDHQDEFVRLHAGKVLVIRGDELVGVHDSEAEALDAARSQWPLGTFLIQRCAPGEESYTQTFHSRVTFA